MAKYTHKKSDFFRTDKGIILMIGVIVVVFVIIMISMFIHTGEKNPATFDQVWNELVNLGYEPIDSSDNYKKQSDNLINSIVVKNENIQFDFFEFDNNNSALNLFHNLYDQTYKKRGYPFQEWDEYYDNYGMYAMSSNDTYYIVIWVGDTTILSECDYEYKNDLFKILNAIGYSGDTKKSETIK